MKVSIEEVSATRKQLVVQMTTEEKAAEEAKVVNAFAKEARLPGFRPGKAPAAVVRAKFGKEIGEELRRTLSQRAFEDAIKEKELRVFSVVDLDAPDLLTTQEPTFRITVDVIPAFDLPDYKNIPVTVPPEEVGDEEVEQFLETLRGQRADFATVERPAQAGDYVKVSYKPTVEGNEIDAQLEDQPNLRAFGSQQNTWEEVSPGEHRSMGVPAVYENLEGMSVGDTKSVDWTFPEDFGVEELVGKPVTYEIEVHEVRERKLPPLDEEFAKSVGVDSVEELRDRVCTQLEQQKQQEVRSQKQRQVINELLQRIEFPVPESAVEAETQNMVRRIMNDNMQRGISQDQLEEHREQIFENARRAAVDQVKADMILVRIAEAEELKAEQEDFQRAIQGMAMQERRSPDEIVKELQKDRSRIEQLQQNIVISKAANFVADNADVTVKEPEPHAHDHDHEHGEEGHKH